MIDRSPRIGSAETAAELRLAQLAAERHPEADLPSMPENYGAGYGRRLLFAEPTAASGYPASAHW